MTITRRQFIPVAVALLVITSMSAPAAAFLGNDTPGTSIVKYGASGSPSFIVELNDDSLSSLEDWANTSTDRTIIRYHNASNTATVAAPRAHVDASVLQRVLAAADTRDLSLVSGDGMLQSRSYVTDLTPNYELSYAEPVSNLTTESGYEGPDLPLRMQLRGQDAPTDGMAFNGDANRTTMAESRQILGADNVSATGAGVTVAVVDTGANTADGEIFGNGTTGSNIRISNASKNYITNESVNATADDYSAIEDGNDHGTWVASSIAANTSNDSHDGLAPDSELLILKALADDGSGETSDIAASIRYAADNDADVISLSLGSPVYSEALADAIAYAYDNGVTAITVATGNSRAQGNPWVASPADTGHVISVGAVNGSESPTAASAYFSQIGPDPGTTDLSEGESQGATIDVAAPGMETVAMVATESGRTNTEALSGTSMATPMVAGSLALALEADSSLTGEHELVHDRVRDTARPIPHAAEVEVGQGMMAVDNAITDTQPETSQADSMTDSASQRDTTYRGMSDASGGLLPLALPRAEVVA